MAQPPTVKVDDICWNCNKPGHISRNCGEVCFRCKKAVHFFATCPLAEDEELVEFFNSLDQNHKGKVTRADLKAALARLGLPETHASRLLLEIHYASK